MRYLSIYRPTAGQEGGMPTAEQMAVMGQLIEEMMAKGKLETTQPLAPRADCVRLTLKGGEFITADETDRAGGFAILIADDRADVIEQAKIFLKLAGEGTCEIRAIPDFGPPPA